MSCRYSAGEIRPSPFSSTASNMASAVPVTACGMRSSWSTTASTSPIATWSVRAASRSVAHQPIMIAVSRAPSPSPRRVIHRAVRARKSPSVRKPSPSTSIAANTLATF
jgi:hypothetical protein